MTTTARQPDRPADADPILDEWFPVAAVVDLEPGWWRSITLLGRRLLLTCDLAGTFAAVDDTCPHRGAMLSLGRFDGERITCPYHGWEFEPSGPCVHQPAHPDRIPPAASGLAPVRVVEAYGLWWVCFGAEPRNLPRFEPYERQPGLSFTIGPSPLVSSGPRIVENFLDLAHFPFVHAGYLGEVPNTEIERYGVDVVDGRLELTGVSVWQPNPGPMATEGGLVAYDYTVDHPYAASLTKIPSEHGGGDSGGFSILIVASPISEVECLVWRVVTVRDPEVDFAAQRAFNETIFDQDIPIVESQLPKLLPLDLRAEVHQPADAGSLAYRRWLIDRGIRYGTTDQSSIEE